MINLYHVDGVHYFVFDSKIDDIDTFITLPEESSVGEFFNYMNASLSQGISVLITKDSFQYAKAVTGKQLNSFFKKHFYIGEEFVTLSPSVRSRLNNISSQEIATYSSSLSIINSL